MDTVPPLYHKDDLKFVEKEISQAKYEYRYRLLSSYSCIILQELHFTEQSPKTANRARRKANEWLRKTVKKLSAPK